ncbi:putative receptor-like protein kinase At3g47110, partial [Gastrolobium bilobum]|uniref:putative receptor-like protein kinase At3g47110 n=1 Tax=Gastrolobium bilobum TaxID=150636 RepID=UPI002AB2B109
FVNQCRKVEEVYGVLKSKKSSEAQASGASGATGSTSEKGKKMDDRNIKEKLQARQSEEKFKRSGSQQSWDNERPIVPKCDNCGRHHKGVCLMGQNVCFKCGRPGHYARDCPQIVGWVAHVQVVYDPSAAAHNGVLHLPNEVGQLKNIDELHVSENHLSGNIPGTIGECSSLEYLYLAGNSFHGIIPSSMASLKGLRHLDLSRNHLSGSIPDVLQNIAFLEYLNVSFNMLDGEVPTKGVFRNASELAVTGNNKLCGGVLELHLPPCPVKGNQHAKHHNFKLITAIVSVVAFLLILSFILTFYWMRKRSKKLSSDSPTIGQLAKVSYQNLHSGTDGFSTRNLIGSGSLGFVYKGIIESEDTIVVIKVLNLQKKGVHKSFIAECNALKNIRHRNLVKILTCCSSTDFKGQEFKALVFEYMTNGSLESWLHPTANTANQPKSLNLEQRLNIISDVASAVHYLHYECEQVVIHCDLKPGNVLLDDCMVAHVSDFGLARLLSSFGVSLTQSSTIGIKGTVGYAPPEYGMGSEVSIEGDMYSFGILILEMLTGRRPTDEMFKDGHNLHNYVKSSLSNHLLRIVDLTILTNEENATDNENLGLMHPNVEKCLHSLFKIALACSMESPKERMGMIDVRKELNLIKSFFPSGI